MDVQDFWEENKRWLMAVLLGAVVFLVGRSMVQFEDTGAAARRATLAELSKERYAASTVTAALDEGDGLQREMERLLGAMVFEPAEGFVIDPAGSSETQFNNAQQDLLRRLEDRAADTGVDLERANVKWPTPNSPAERRRTLVGMALLDASMQRLFRAHEEVRAADPTARGVTAIAGLRVGDVAAAGRATPRPGGMRRGMRGRGARSVDGSQYLNEETLEFKIELDSATLALWLEYCRGQGNPMSLSAFTVQGPNRNGEPVTVSGTLAAVTFDRERFDDDLENASQEENR